MSLKQQEQMVINIIFVAIWVTEIILKSDLIFFHQLHLIQINEQLFLSILNINFEFLILITLASVTVLYVIKYGTESPTLVFSQQLLVADLK